MIHFFTTHLLFSDLMIDRENSTALIESWKGHKITMKCFVRKAFSNSTVTFYWLRSNGQPLPGREVYFKDRELSQKTLVTDTDAQFDPVRCTAKTETSTQTLDITIKRLREWLYLVVPPLLPPSPLCSSRSPRFPPPSPLPSTNPEGWNSFENCWYSAFFPGVH